MHFTYGRVNSTVFPAIKCNLESGVDTKPQYWQKYLFLLFIYSDQHYNDIFATYFYYHTVL